MAFGIIGPYGEDNMETVDVMVQVFDRGEVRRTVVPVEEECFEKACWKSIANIKAAVILEVPFTLLERAAKYGLRPEDKARLCDQAIGNRE